MRDVIDGRSHLTTVLGMLVRQHQLSGRPDPARLISMRPLHLFRPHPAVVIEIEPKPSRAGAAAQAVGPGRAQPRTVRPDVDQTPPYEHVQPIQLGRRLICITRPRNLSVRVALPGIKVIRPSTPRGLNSGRTMGCGQPRWPVCLAVDGVNMSRRLSRRQHRSMFPQGVSRTFEHTVARNALSGGDSPETDGFDSRQLQKRKYCSCGERL